MRALALLLAVASCTTTTKISVRGDDLYRRLPELRRTGRADVPTLTTVDDKRTDDAGVATIELDTRLVLEDRPRTLLQLAAGCSGDPVSEDAIEECYLKAYRKDPFVLHERTTFDLGLAAKTTLAVIGIAGYGLMANCAWNCENDTRASVSLIGVGIVGALSIAFAIGRAVD